MNTTQQPQKELILTRTVNAPRELVWAAWTQADHLKQWWGPNGFTIPECEVDLRVGGRLWIVMRGSDGTDYPMSGIFQVIDEPAKLSYTAAAEAADGSHLLEGSATVTFEEQDGKTVVTVETKMVGLVSYAEQMLSGMEQGWNETVDRMVAFITK